MFTWTYSETVPTTATREQIWDMWRDAETWPAWDSELDWVNLGGEFAKGTKGRMKPSRGPEIDFVLDEVIPNQSFSNKAQLPLTTMMFRHEYLSPSDTGQTAQARHSVTMTGMLAPLFGRVIGSTFRTHLRAAMLELVRRASSARPGGVGRPKPVAAV